MSALTGFEVNIEFCNGCLNIELWYIERSYVYTLPYLMTSNVHILCELY